MYADQQIRPELAFSATTLSASRLDNPQEDIMPKHNIEYRKMFCNRLSKSVTFTVTVSSLQGMKMVIKNHGCSDQNNCGVAIADNVGTRFDWDLCPLQDKIV